MTINSGFEAPIDPEAGASMLFEGVTQPVADTPAAAPEVAPTTEPAATAEPDPAPESEASLAEELAALEQMVTKVLGREAPAPASPESATPAPAAEQTKDRLSALIESFEEGSEERQVLSGMLERINRLEARDAERIREAEQAEAEAEVAAYVRQAQDFAKKYPGATGDIIETVAGQHAAMVEQDESMASLRFEEVARRVLGDDALEAMRKPVGSPAPSPKSPAPAASAPAKGHPVITPGAGGGGAPTEAATPFSPGPGRGFADILDHERKAGNLAGLVRRS